MNKIIKMIIIGIVAFGVIGFAAFNSLAGFFAPKDMDESLRPDAASQFFDSHGKIIATTASEERRLPVPFEEIPKILQEAFISIEDTRFYEHAGIDYIGTSRALINNIFGNEVQGGSTITQQLAKNAFLSQERTIIRKIKEAFISKQLEEHYTKDEILNMYLNRIYFGEGTYGVESASLYYFDKHVKNITLAEAATLAAIPKSPNYFNPIANPKESKLRQELVLDQMVKYGYITPEEAIKAKAEKLSVHATLKNKKQKNNISYFIDYCSQQIIKEFGADALYKGGLKIYTTLDLKMQAAAANSMQHLPNFYTDDYKLTQPQAALIALDPTTGYIKAMIGGRGQDKFNRATMAVRQPGSAFKPFVYLTAMANDMTPASVVEDKEYEFADGWKPKNSNSRWHGKVSLRTALTKSINIPTILVCQEIGPGKVINTAKQLGISTLIEDGHYSDVNLAMALGGLSKGVIPLEMAAAYGTLANNGNYNEPSAILKIINRDDKVIYESKIKSKSVINPKAAYMTIDMMQGVFVNGTAAGAGIGRPAAGKTGTTDDSKDAWFVGFTPNLSTAVWIGDDNGLPLNDMYGSQEPLTIWRSFMMDALANIPAPNFKRPSGIEIPAEPDLSKEDEKKKEKELEEQKAKAEREEKKKTTIPSEKPPQPPKKRTEPEKNKKSMKERVDEILGENTTPQTPVISNVPVPVKRN